MTTGQGHTPHHTTDMENLLFKRLPKLVLASSIAIISVAGNFAHAQEQGAAGLNASQNGLQNLENFVKNTKSGRAAFTQIVTSPAKEGQAVKSKTSSGTFEFLRPNRFKFVYKKPFEQTIVSDGKTLWLYDADLNQTTSRKLAQVLNGTPAAVIAAAADLKGLQADFDLASLPEKTEKAEKADAKTGLQWVQATPKTKDGQLQNIIVGFKVTDKGSELAALEILDSFGQRSVMTFNQFEVNPTLAPASFQFKPPVGSDVIRH